jgi:hypothetical protein
MQVSLIACVGANQCLRRRKTVASTSKTVSEFITMYYGHQFAQAVEQIDVEIVMVGDEATITDALKVYFPDLDNVISPSDPSDEQFLIHIETAGGNHFIGKGQGRWLLIMVVTICLMIALLVFGEQTVISILHTILSTSRG